LPSTGVLEARDGTSLCYRSNSGVLPSGFSVGGKCRGPREYLAYAPLPRWQTISVYSSWRWVDINSPVLYFGLCYILQILHRDKHRGVITVFQISLLISSLVIMLVYDRTKHFQQNSKCFIHVNNSSGVILQLHSGLFQITACAVLMSANLVQTPCKMSLVVIQ
jgi:hypothetical protein